MSKNNKKQWWYDKYDFDDEFYNKEKQNEDNYDDFAPNSWWKTSYKNPTKSWMSKLGSYTYSYGASKDEKYQKVLKQLQTSINIINDNEIVVKWSNGENVNNPKENIIYLSPNNLLKSGEIDDNELDVLTGEVYLSRMIKEQASKDYTAKKSKTENALWQALEINIAKSNLEKDWPGFIPNVLKTLDQKSCEKKEVEDLLNQDETSLEAITSGLSWNLINPHDMVEIPEKYHGCLDAASDILADDSVEYNRLGACKQIINKIKQILNIKEEDCKAKMPVSDLETVFGKAAVPNDVDAALSNQDSSSKKDDLTEDTSKYEKDIGEEVLESRFIIMKDSNPVKYNKMVLKLKNQINYIKSNLMFMDNKIHSHSFGHLSGDIDENSLFKIKLKDERLMSRPEKMSRKDNAFCFLLDESGSMFGTSIEEAKQVLITLLEALKHQFNVCVYGHTAEDYISDFFDDEQENYFEGTSIMEYFSLRNPNYKSIINAEGRCENFDGMAIKQCGKKLLQDYPESRKILFHICDGRPHTSYMNGIKGKKYVNDVSQALRRQGVEVYCIGICDAFSDCEGKEMYGDGNFVVIKDILSSVNILSRFIQQICNKSVATYVQS